VDSTIRPSRRFDGGDDGMSRKRNRLVNLPAPYLKRVWLDASLVGAAQEYPFCLPFLRNGFELDFDRAITIIVGENGTGKSTLLEGIAVLAGYDEAGGGKGYRPVDHSRAIEAMGGRLSQALRASWLPKITNGWFFRAESFFSVARYLDEAAIGAGPPPDFLSHSHGEGFLHSSLSAANGRASSSSTNRNRRCLRTVKSSS
jgi:predicted ATPase